MKHPETNREGYDRNRLHDLAENLHGRLLLFHGTYDDNVHPQNTWRLVNELIDAGIPFDLGVYPMRKHGFRDSAARLHSKPNPIRVLESRTGRRVVDSNGIYRAI